MINWVGDGFAFWQAAKKFSLGAGDSFKYF